MKEIIQPRRCGKTERINFMKNLNEVILNTTATTTSPNVWQEQTKNEIINNLISFVEQMNQEDDDIQPPWSSVRIKDKEEVERLMNLRQNLKLYYNHPNPTGEVYFLGYMEKEEKIFDVFFIPFLKTILHISLKPIGIENVFIDGTITM